MIIIQLRNLTYTILVAFGLFQVNFVSGQEKGKTWKFVSIPDFLNVDVDFPEPTWDETLDFVLQQIKNENPDFVVVAGDMVMGRWWRNKSQLDYMADKYYSAWKNRMNKFGLQYYVAVGDHELGDNPWRPDGIKGGRGMGTLDCAPIKFIPYFEEAYLRNFDMPKNGPDGKKGLTYYFEHNKSLFIGLDVFEKDIMPEGGQRAQMSEKQLHWLESLLQKKGGEVDHIIVYAHTPILGPVRKQNSSGLMYHEGRESKLWQILKKYNTDVYLCGEVHAMTCIEKDNIQQIAHGGLFGYNTNVNYLVCTVSENEIQFELKELVTYFEGAHLPQSAGNEPRLHIKISEKNLSEGYKTVGKMVMQKVQGEKKFIDKSGFFIEDDNPK